MDALDYLTLFLLIALAIQIVRIRAYKIVPLFSVYIWFAVIAGIFRFAVSNHPHSYLLVYWTTETGYVALELTALYEVFRLVFGGLTQTWWFRLLVPSSLILSLVFVSVRTFQSPPKTSSHWAALVITFELAVRLLQALMCVTLVPTVILFPQRWKQYPIGITSGFGIYAIVTLIATSPSGFVTKHTSVWGSILVGAYSVSVVIWLWFFHKPQPKDPGEPGLSLDEAHRQLDQYQSFLRRM